MSPVTRSIQSQLALEARAIRAAIYRNPMWRGPGGTRARVLTRAQGTCQYPTGCTSPATIADHWPLTLATILATGGDPYDDTQCRALCAHHSGVSDGGRT